MHVFADFKGTLGTTAFLVLHFSVLHFPVSHFPGPHFPVPHFPVLHFSTLDRNKLAWKWLAFTTFKNPVCLHKSTAYCYNNIICFGDSCPNRRTVL